MFLFFFLFLEYKSKHVCDNLYCLVCVLAYLSTLTWATSLLLLLRLVHVGFFLYLFPLSFLPDSIAYGSWLCGSLVDWARGCHGNNDEFFCLRLCWWWLFLLSSCHCLWWCWILYWALDIACDDVGYFTELLPLPVMMLVTLLCYSIVYDEKLIFSLSYCHCLWWCFIIWALLSLSCWNLLCYGQ